jgi:hypothetical protein
MKDNDGLRLLTASRSLATALFWQRARSRLAPLNPTNDPM